jgi:hypothetical protein
VNRSDEVRDFYEKMPYPAPLANLDHHSDLYKNPDRRRAELHLIWPDKQPREGQEILIAGCGTSLRSASQTRGSQRSTSATRAYATHAIFSASTIWKI